MKSHIVEEEMLENQMKKLSLENCTLQLESKLLKDKYVRATAHITGLEKKLQESQNELKDLQAKVEEDCTQMELSLQTDMQREIDQHKLKAANSATEVVVLKSKISYLEEQLDALRKECETIKLSMDKSKSYDVHRQEIQTFQEEMAHLKRLLEESELSCTAESTRCKGLIGQVQKLSEIQEVLQLQIEQVSSEGSPAEKQMASLQVRLRVTEERLTQERADRANNLSQNEEKLLSENSKLQTVAKELDRLLKREREKARTFEQRANELREENLQLRLALPEKDDNNYSIPYSRSIKHKSSQQQACDIKEIWQQLESESGLSCPAGDMDSLVVSLWGRCQDLQHTVTEWQLYLEQLELPFGDGSFNLQDALMVKTEYEAKMQHIEEKFEDISAEKIAAEQTYKQQLTDLVKERHEAFARLKTFEDLLDALKAENESLRQSLAATSGNLGVTPREGETGESCQLEMLRTEVVTLESSNSQQTRRNKVLESEMNTLRCQLASRDKELVETFAELKSAQAAPKSNLADEQLKQQRIHSLISEVASGKEELHLLSERHLSVQAEKSRLDAELREVKEELRTARRKNRDQDLDSNLIQKNQAEKLTAEIEKKDEEIVKLTTKLNDNLAALFMTKSELTIQQKTCEHMEAEVESIQQQLDQRCQVLDNLSAKESDQLEHLEMVKGMIHSLNKELAHKQGELEILQLKMQQANAKIAKLEEQNDKLNSIIENPSFPGDRAIKSSPLATDLRISEIKAEKESLEAQMLQTTNSMASLREDNEALNAEVSKVKQEGSTTVASNTKMAAENASLERRVKTLEEEKALVQQERDSCRESLIKHEASLHELAAKFESATEVQLGGFSAEYSGKSEDEQKIIKELHAVQLLMFAKEKENSLVMDKIQRQEQELRNFERKCELLQVENGQNRKYVSRITDELFLKMKEISAVLELNRMLLKDHSSLQKHVAHIETQLLHEKERTEHRSTEVNDIIKKIEHSEQTSLATSLMLQQKDSIISDQEVRLRQLSHSLNQTEAERDSLKSRVDNLTESLRSLSQVNTGLEQKLEARDAAIRDEQSAVSKQKEEILTLNHRLEILKHEETLMLSNLASERKVQDKLKESIKSHEMSIQNLNERIAVLTRELDLQKGQVVATVETARKTKEDKETIMKDYQEMCRRLGEKETVLQEVQKKKAEEVSEVKQEAMKQMQAVSLEKVTVDRDLEQLKREIDDLKIQLERKEEQVASLGQTLKELEDAKRKISNLESYTAEQNKIAAETKILVESLRNELFSVRDKNDELHDTIARKEVVIIDLKDKLRHSGESKETQVTDLKHTIEGMRSHHEYEKKSLRETHSKVEEKFQTSAQEIRALKESNDRLTEQVHSQEKLLAEAGYKLSQEEAARKHTEGKLKQLQETVDDLTRRKTALEENVNSLQMSINKTEAEHTVVRERTKHLTSQLKSVQVALSASEGALKEREEKIENLKGDVLRQQQILEDHRHQATNRLHKVGLELKQQVELKEKDQTKLNHQAHQLSVDLEQAREFIIIKNKENLKLQERVLELENRVREGETILKHKESSLKQEEEMQSRLINRFEEQESELKKLRNFLAKKADETGDGKEIWQEMNHVLSELSHQLHVHIETSRTIDQSGKDSSELVNRLRRSLLEVESQLNTERALHAVTQSSMQALEEDCARLRQTISAIRRRGTQTEKKQKSRMEEINAIIARGQTRAQALLTSGEFSLDESLRNLNPSRDYTLGDTSFSPDTSFASDAGFGGAHLANLSFLNLSGNLGTFSPRK